MLGFGMLSAVAGPSRWNESDRESRIEPTATASVDEFYDDSYVNNIIARGSAFLGEGDTQVPSYYDSTSRVVLATRRLQETTFDRAIVTDTAEVGLDRRWINPHRFISGGLDRMGRIHLMFGAHNSQPTHVVSNGSPSRQSWTRLPPWPGRDGRKVSYPYLVRGRDSALWLFFRDGGAGNGRTLFVRDLAATMSTVSPLLLIDGKGENSQYLFSPLFGPDGCLHLAWTWRLSNLQAPRGNPYRKPGFLGVTNRDIAYARTCDGGFSWTSGSGRSHHWPLVWLGRGAQRAETIDESDIGESFFNHYGSDYDGKKQPHHSYYHHDRSRTTQLWHLYFSGKR